ncbi:nucleoside diphosphate-linked moiety X motif 17-like [Mya arenaria]|uniref:nucleoside diphosphate-linked moiety X motif 17-like n=1 Tax=Mya arenaria TaxID=6604 RepID=UPI0022E6162E|nr:nucleoside diphosphate-linked moiety X motif 17-like [Mya arenaria]
MLTLQFFKQGALSIFELTPNLKHFLKVSTINSKCHPLSTSSSLSFRYETMAQPPNKRVLVKLLKNGAFESAHFTQCLVDELSPGCADGVCSCVVDLDGASLLISPPQTDKHLVKLKHPPFCPFHALTKEEIARLPEEINNRGMDCGAAVILESGNGHILLIRRAEHLRTFPGIWVPAGGHIEPDETLSSAGLRELHEETGLTITEDMCTSPVSILAVWESVFPPKLSLGQPKRHHAVVYLHARLKPEFTSTSLEVKVNMDPEEVGACAWFDRSKVKAIVASREDEGNKDEGDSSDIPELFSALIIDKNKQQVAGQLEFADLLKTAREDKDQRGRVSTGTKFALEEWLTLT